MGSLFNMTVYRVKKVIAWALAVCVLALLAFGGYYVVVVL